MRIKNKKLRILLSRKLSVAAAVVLIIMILTAFIGPFLTTYDPHEMDLSRRYAGISREHWLGADHMGRDLFTRIVHGGQTSIGLAFFGVSIGVSFGLLLGLISGYYGGIIDVLASRFIDFLMAVPTFMIAIISLAILGSGGINSGIAVGISTIPLFMRIARAQVLVVRESEHVKAALMTGVSDLRIIMTYILPEVLPLIVVAFTINLGTALLTISILAYLGIGVTLPTIEWGSIMSGGRGVMIAFPLGVIAPGIAVTLFVTCTSLLGDGLKDAFDPKAGE